jgi:uncharacterized DUF497 family protein
MKIVNDPRKRRINVERHGYDLADLTVEFFEGATVIDAKQGRLMAIGEFGGKIVAVVFMRLGSEGLSVISMRPASRKERKVHDPS